MNKTVSMKDIAPIQKKRARAIEKSMRLVWDSLQSHLPYTHIKSAEGRDFHLKCVKEYLVILNELLKLY